MPQLKKKNLKKNTIHVKDVERPKLEESIEEEEKEVFIVKSNINPEVNDRVTENYQKNVKTHLPPHHRS